jgi:ParB-like chromosome segregation protein Spo0J
MSLPDLSHNPICRVEWVPVEKVFANDYNPNTVAQTEMDLLYLSIREDGYTQPVVTYQAGPDRWEVVDGFHRYLITKTRRDIYEKNHGLLPIVVIDKPINQRMASTIRHNRARGKHTVAGMSSLVIEMLNNGWTDARICHEIGLEPEELRRLKHVTGYAKFFLNGSYSRATETPVQIEERLKYEEGR